MAPPKANCDHLHRVVNGIDSGLQAVTVSWADTSRGVDNKQLSCMGKNITDQRLVAEDGEHLPFVRPQNHNEMLGVISADQINCGEVGTLADVWENLEAHIRYRYKGKIKRGSVDKVVTRFQETFVPVQAGGRRSVAPSSFSYQTLDAANPCNLLLVVTPLGIDAHTDGVGPHTLCAHKTAEDGSIKQSWFETTESEYASGHAQVEVGTKPSGGGRSKTLGVRGSGDRCNRMLIISIPLEQTPVPPARGPPENAFGGLSGSLGEEDVPVYRSLGEEDAPVYRSLGGAPPSSKCRAARLGVGCAVGDVVTHDMDLVVDGTQPVMCTQIDYNVLVPLDGGNEVTIPDGDARYVADALTLQYKLCDAVCKLSELPVCLHALEKKHTEHIQHTFEAVAKKAKMRKATEDPFTPNADALSLVVSPADL